ncbi:hypothetical protein HWV62_39517 [Athelia sp. TMB]|nr:hypothetical protein HWV62_39517 [Athelia sp. TMB]
MGGMSSSALLRLAGWSYLPDFATKQALQFAYNTSLPIPPRYRPNPAKHPRNYRLTFAFICLTYLTYTLVSSLLSIPPNFYEILHTSPNADDAALKTAFRTFAKVYHPDRRGGEGEQWFGEDVLTWSHLSTRADYIQRGLMASSGYHISTFAALLFFGALGQPSPIAFWRYWLCASLFAAELYLLLSPSLSNTSDAPVWLSALKWAFPTRVAFQHIRFMHHMFLFGSVALSRVAPTILPLYYEFLGIQYEDIDLKGENGQRFNALLARFSALVQAADRELFAMIQTDIQSVIPEAAEARTGPEPPPEVLAALEKEMTHIMIENRLKTAAPLVTAWHQALKKGRDILRARTQSAPEPTALPEKIYNGNSINHDCGLLSPTSPNGVLKGSDLVAADKEAEVIGQGRLPSPRPSPPPGLVRRVLERNDYQCELASTTVSLPKAAAMYFSPLASHYRVQTIVSSAVFPYFAAFSVSGDPTNILGAYATLGHIAWPLPNLGRNQDRDTLQANIMVNGDP